MELQQLIIEAQAGDEAAFSEICRRFTGLVKKYARQPHIRPLAEDAEGEAWLALVRAVRTYRPEAGVQPAGYIESQVKYAIWNLFKKERRHWQNEMTFEAGDEGEGSLLDTLAAGDNVEAAVEQKLVMAGLVAALAALPPKQQTAIRLTLLQGGKLADAAGQIGVTLQAVHNLRQRGLLRLQKLTN